MLVRTIKIAALVSSMGMATLASAAPFSEIRIGDIDGFGYNADTNLGSLVGADGAAADRNGSGLGAGDLLPDLNQDGCLATGCRDDFDNRLGEGVSATGATNLASAGANFTDIALTTSYDSASAAGRVYNANTGTMGSGGAFPMPPSSTRPNQPGFLFDFFVEGSDIVAGTDIYFNMLFADYDVTPAEIDFNFAGSSLSKSVTPQNNGPDDGLIQGAFALLNFADVFTASGTGYHGYVQVDFDARNEPYTAFDYVELSATPIVVNVAEPSVFILLAMGFVGLLVGRKRLV